MLKAAAASATGRISELGAELQSGGDDAESRIRAAEADVEARRLAVAAVARERAMRNRAVDVVVDEPGDDLFMAVGRQRTAWV